MSTGARKVIIFLKKFLTQQQITENFQEYLERLILESFGETWQSQGVFSPNLNTQNLFSSDTVDTFDLFTPLRGTNGPLGNILNLDAADANNIAFENTNAIDYSVGLRFVQIESGVETNVRTGEKKYTFFEEGIGEKGEPNSVVDDGDETLTMVVDNVFENGVSSAGRKVLVYLKNPVSDADTFETLTVIFTGGQHKIETSAAFGQQTGFLSTDPADYTVIALGPTVRRNTDLSLDPDIMFLGVVTGKGIGNSPDTFNQSAAVNLSLGLAGITNLFDAEHSLVDGTHEDITAETITTKQAIQGIQLDTQVNVGDEDTPDAPITHTLFQSAGGSGLQSAKWAIRDSGGNVIAFLDAHGNAYFQNISAAESIFQSNLIVQGDTTLGNSLAADSVIFNAVQKSLTDMIYIIDSNDDGTNSYKFYNHSESAGNLLLEILDVGDIVIKRDVLTGTGSAYSKNSDLSPVISNASLNEVYDETLNRKLLKASPNNPADKVVLINASHFLLADGSEFKLVNGDEVADYDGGTINFSTGAVTGGGAGFTPFDFTGNDDTWFKYSLSLLPTNEIVVIPASGVGATQALAPEPLFQSGAIAFAVITVQNDSATSTTAVEDIVESNLTRIPIGGAGGGAGEADVQTEFIINNAQGAPLNLTDLIFDKTETKAVDILFEVSRDTDSPTSLVEFGTLRLVLDGPSNLWRQPVISNSDFDDAGVVFTVDTATGQIKYTSSNIAGGSYDGTLRIRDIKKVPITSPSNKIINNAQGAPLNLTDLIFDKTTTKAVNILFEVSRETDSPTSLVEFGELVLVLDTPSNLWRQPVISNSDFDDAGVTFTVDTSTGQLKYVSTNMAGASYVGILRVTNIIEMSL